MERLEGVALLLILALCVLADGLMEAYGPGGFALVSAITMTAAEALRRAAKGKPPCASTDQSEAQESR